MSISNDLRQAVLQAAIQGKLTKQLPEDGNAKDLLEQIKAEKAKLIKEGKLKKEKPLPEITEDEKHFDIPENWEWCRFADVIKVDYGGGTPSKENISYWNGDIPWMSVKDYAQNPDYVYGTIEHITSEAVEDSSTNLIDLNHIIICTRVGLGKIAVNRVKLAINQDLRAIKLMNQVLDSYFIWHYKSLNVSGTGTTVKGIKRIELLNFLIPLPPLSEQKRIVAKVEELMAKIDELEKTEQELEALKKAFPADMKASLLQAAIQGKLTEQLPEDGNAKDLLEQIKAEKTKLIKEGKLKKEKPLPEITEDEKPFDIPENWKWCRIGDLFLHSSGKQQSSNNKSGGSSQKFITTSNLYWGRFVLDNVKVMDFTDAEIKSCSATKGDLLVCEGGAGYGRSAIWNEDYDICLQNHIHRLRPCAVNVCEYVYHCIYFLKENNKLAPVGTAMPGLSANRLKGLLIPLPPLVEQKRIVEKLEKLLPLCDGLK